MISRLARLLVLSAASMPCAALAAVPDMPPHGGDGAPRASVLDAAHMVSNDELSKMRGGFFTAAGAQFDFGASVQTLVNGQVALQTNVQWTPAGAVTQQLAGLGAAIQQQVTNTVDSNLAKAGIATPGSAVQSSATPSLTTENTSPMAATNTANSLPASAPAAASTAPAAMTTAQAPASTTAAPTTTAGSAPASAPISTPAAVSTTPTIATAAQIPASTPAATTPATTPANAPVNVSVNAPAAGTTAPTIVTGVQIPGATGGSTQVLANVGANQIQNIILNSASGQTIAQNTNIALTIYNFAPWQQQMAQNMLSARLANDMMAASGISLGH